jgi:hypothetical protein
VGLVTPSAPSAHASRRPAGPLCAEDIRSLRCRRGLPCGVRRHQRWSWGTAEARRCRPRWPPAQQGRRRCLPQRRPCSPRWRHARRNCKAGSFRQRHRRRQLPHPAELARLRRRDRRPRLWTIPWHALVHAHLARGATRCQTSWIQPYRRRSLPLTLLCQHLRSEERRTLPCLCRHLQPRTRLRHLSQLYPQRSQSQ